MTYLTGIQAAQLLGLAPETVRVYARGGRLTRYYPGGIGGTGRRVYYDQDEVQELARERELQPERRQPPWCGPWIGLRGQYGRAPFISSPHETQCLRTTHGLSHRTIGQKPPPLKGGCPMSQG